LTLSAEDDKRFYTGGLVTVDGGACIDTGEILLYAWQKNATDRGCTD
jgi:hypothetical protein